MRQRRATAATTRSRAPDRPRQSLTAPVKPSLPTPAQPHPTSAVLELQRLAGNSAVAAVATQRFELDDAVDAVARAGGTIASVLAVGASVLLAKDREAALLASLVRAGFTDRSKLANVVFWLRHPERLGTRIERGEHALAAEWLTIRRTEVDPALARAVAEPATEPGGAPSPKSGPAPAPPSPSAKPMSEPERERFVEAAKQQGSSGSEKLKAQMEAALPMRGGTRLTLDEWFADHVPDATFLGLRIRASGGTSPGVHKEFLTRLQKAETALRATFPGQADEAIRARLGVTDIAGLRPPKLATGGTLPSMHCFGMAVDINAATNPFVGNVGVSKKIKDPAKRAEVAASRSPRVIERAMLLLHGEHLDIETDARLSNKKEVERVYDLHDRASQALADYLKLADASDAELLPLIDKARAGGDPHDLAWWRDRIATDRKLLPNFDFARHKRPDQTGYMDLAKELVLALTKEGGLLWGGTYGGAKDMMHFDYRDGSIRRHGK